MILISPKHFFMLKIFVFKKRCFKIIKIYNFKKKLIPLFSKNIYMSEFYLKKKTQK